MNTKSFDYLNFIGRFQPYHAGHHNVAKRALQEAHNLIFIIGTDDSPRTSRDPFSTKERIDIIRSCFTPQELEYIHFLPQWDFPYNNEKWLASVSGGVHAIVWKKFNPGPVKIGLIGLQKDRSSFYLKQFPQWGHIDVLPTETVILDATNIRNAYLSNIPYYNVKAHGGIDWAVNEVHRKTVLDLFASSEMEVVKREFTHVINYKQQWNKSPHPPIFSTVDACVVQSGHILLVRRGAMPGEGLVALPGGFVEQDETLADAALRELREETKLKVPEPVLRGSLVANRTFDHPYRSQRGRTITQAYYFKLADRETLPDIKGSDDAKEAFWWDLDKVSRSHNLFFEDHWSIIDALVGL